MKIICNKNENHMKYFTIELEAKETLDYIDKVRNNQLRAGTIHNHINQKFQNMI
jgi:hypothetical protein